MLFFLALNSSLVLQIAEIQLNIVTLMESLLRAFKIDMWILTQKFETESKPVVPLHELVTWYKICDTGWQAMLKQRRVKLDWLKLLCFGGCHILFPSRMTDFIPGDHFLQRTHQRHNTDLWRAGNINSKMKKALVEVRAFSPATWHWWIKGWKIDVCSLRRQICVYLLFIVFIVIECVRGYFYFL